MGVGLRVEVDYDAVSDQVFLTSVSPDWNKPVLLKSQRGTPDDSKLRDLLQEEGIFDPEQLGRITKLPTANDAGKFGVYSNGVESFATIATTSSLFVAGKEGSGVLNLVRNYLLWALETNVKVITVNAPDDVYGLAGEFDDGQLLNISSDILVEIMEAERFCGKAGGEKILVIVNANKDIEDTPKYWRQFQKNLFANQQDNQRFLFFSEKLLDEEAGVGEGFYWASDEVFGSGFIGDVNEATMQFILEGLEEVPVRNPRGVLWLSTFSLERINTYLIPREFTLIAG